MASKTPTFKNHPRPKGLMSMTHQPTADILFNKMSCGYITRDAYWEKTSKYRIRLTVVEVLPPGEEGCGWKWITLKAAFNDMQAAKDFVKAKWADIEKAYALRYTEPTKH